MAAPSVSTRRPSAPAVVVEADSAVSVVCPTEIHCVYPGADATTGGYGGGGRGGYGQGGYGGQQGGYGGGQGGYGQGGYGGGQGGGEFKFYHFDALNQANLPHRLRRRQQLAWSTWWRLPG